MKVQVVIGANYGDEGKGLVSGCLAREASLLNERTLTVFYNGTAQRAHTFEGEVHRCMAAGSKYGSDTFYYETFVVDPISLLITQAKPIIDPRCRVILPCDVIANRAKERKRGKDRHGSCGFGLFEAVARSRIPSFNLRIKDFLYPDVSNKLLKIKQYYGKFDDEIYNDEILEAARRYIVKHCRVIPFENLLLEENYDRIIFEGGQGLLLDQRNMQYFPHLTPSCPGSFFISMGINDLLSKETPELFYVSRSYMTRHGAGPMKAECTKQEINPDIVDLTNEPNEFQGSLRFGKLDVDALNKRILADAAMYKNPKVNLVFTQLNYTAGKLETTQGRREIFAPDFVDNIYASDQKDQMIIL